MKTFYVGIKGVITRDDKVLILKKANGSGDGIWEVPGGRINGDETIREALLRELAEELPNIKNILVDEILGASRVHKDLEPGISLVLVFYRVTAEFNGMLEKSDEHSEFKWATLEEALSLVTESYKQAIVRAMQDQP